MPVVNDYTALLSGSYWNGIEATGAPVIVTYSFPTSLPAYDASIPGFTPATDASFLPFTAAEQIQAQNALGEWSAASGLIFLQVAPGLGDINFTNVDLSTTSYGAAGGVAFYPFGDWSFASYPSFFSDLTASGDVFMNSQYLSGGQVNYGTLLHEIGHAIGLKHPTEIVTDYAAQPDPVVHDQVLSSDDPTRTIMATVGDGSTTDAHLLPLDQQAAAFLYGAAGTGGVYTASASGTNSVSAWSWNAVTQTLTQTAVSTGETIRGSSVNDVINGSSGDDKLFGLAGTNVLYGNAGNDQLFGSDGTNTLVGGIGDDTYYVSGTATTIVENPGEGFDSVYSTVNFTLSANIEYLQLFGQGLTGTGNDQGDTIFGDGTYANTLIGGTGNDYIAGGAGDDIIVGGGGSDQLYGDGGANTFVFRSITDAPVGQAPTYIGDFSQTDGDRIDLSGIHTPGGQPLFFIGTAAFTHVAGQLRQNAPGSDTLIQGDVNGDGIADFQIDLGGAHALQSQDFILSPPCYRSGTRLLTCHGEREVETLAIGDRLITAAGQVRSIQWIGHRRVDCRRHPDPRRVWPVRVRKDAFAKNQPHRDLYLSPDHAVFAAGVLIPIKLLINGSTIEQTPVDAVAYYHVELAEHSILLAEGLPAESYLDTGNRRTFANAGPTDLHPTFDLPATWPDNAAAPLAVDAARVRPVWEALAARSETPIQQPTLTTDPQVRLQVNGRVIEPVLSTADHCVFVLPDHTGLIRLVSRFGHPTDATPWSDDTRRLGINISRILWHSPEGPHEMPVDHPELSQGWWTVESHDAQLRRWTNGDAMLPAPPNATIVEFHLASGMQYRPLPEPARGQRPSESHPLRNNLLR